MLHPTRNKTPSIAGGSKTGSVLASPPEEQSFQFSGSLLASEHASDEGFLAPHPRGSGLRRSGGTPVRVKVDAGDEPEVMVGSVESSASHSSLIVRSPRPHHQQEDGVAETTVSQTVLAREVASAKKKKRKRINFDKNIIKSIDAYEFNNQVVVDIEYQRNRLGWLLLLLGLVADVATVMTVVWASYIEFPTVSNYAFTWWGAVWQLPLYLLVVSCTAVTDFVEWADLKELLSAKILPYAIALGLFFSLFSVGQLYAANREFEMGVPPQYLPFVNFGLVWVLLYRRWKGGSGHIFLNEILSTVVIIVGYILVTIPNFIAYSHRLDFWALNGILLGISCLVALWIVFMEKVQMAFNTIIVALLPSLVINICVFLLSGVIALGEENLGPRGFWKIFQGDALFVGLAIAFTSFFMQFFYLAACRYLDAISIAATVALKATLLPYGIRFITTNKRFPAVIRTAWLQSSDGKSILWTPFLFAGTAVVVIACSFLVVFASVKRQLITQRILSTAPLRKPKDPYAPKRSGKEPLPTDEQGMPVPRPKRLGRVSVLASGANSRSEIDDDDDDDGYYDEDEVVEEEEQEYTN